MRNHYTFYLIGLISLVIVPHTQGQGITFAESLQQVYDSSNVLHMAEQRKAVAHTMRQSINATWYPSITAMGTYTWMSDRIEVSSEYSSLLQPFDSYFNKNIITQEIGRIIYNFLGDKSFTVPIMDQQWATADVALVYPIFTGGKRIYGSTIGRELENIGNLGEKEARAAIFLLWVETYYGLQLAIQNEAVRKDNLQAITNHYNNVLAYKSNGMASEMDLLVAKVAMEEAEREWKSATRNTTAIHYTFCKMMGTDTSFSYTTLSPLFICNSIPPIQWFIEQANISPIVQAMESQKIIADNKISIAKADYLPTIAVFGKQTLASYNVPQNLMPPTILGATMVWNIFDGLKRERNIKRNKIEAIITNEQYREAQKQNEVAIQHAYTELQKANDEIKALSTTIEMTNELVRIRNSAYSEGLATTTDVVDAQTSATKTKLLLLAAYYHYDLALATLLSICGTPEYFEQWNK